MKKILISGPILSRSGYGEMSRFAFRSLIKNPNVDLYIIPMPWGGTGWLFEDNEERRIIDNLIVKTVNYNASSNNNPVFDISIQISLPSEWKKLAAYNVGYTAGIETNFISPRWFEGSSLVDKIVVISEHAKAAFVNTLFNNQHGQQFKVQTQVEVIHLPFMEHTPEPLDLDFKYDFNYLAVCQWAPRKNLEQTITGFLEEFLTEEVGLVLKINTVNDSLVDRYTTQKRLENILKQYPNRKCSVSLLHGHLTEQQMTWLYRHPKIKAIVSTTHGEGYGLPLMEAAASTLPVIATDWSGHLDFLYVDGKRMFGKIDYELKPIAKEHVWPGVLEEGTSWAFPITSSYKNKMRELYKDYGRFKSQADKLAPHVRELVNLDKLLTKFSETVYKEYNVEEWLKTMDIKDVKEYE